MACDCVGLVNAQLAKHNTRLVRSVYWTKAHTCLPNDGTRIDIEFGNVLLATEKLDTSKRGKPLPVIAAHCPFCGVSWKEQDVETGADS